MSDFMVVKWLAIAIASAALAGCGGGGGDSGSSDTNSTGTSGSSARPVTSSNSASGSSSSTSSGSSSPSSAAALPPASSAATGNATVSWLAPTQNTDGSALTNLTGYRILYGRDSKSLSQSVQISNPGINTYVLESLTAGTWYFTVKAITGNGMESDASNIASKTI